MTFYAYSKINELLTGVKSFELEHIISQLSKYMFSNLRKNCLIKLSILEKATISKILKELKQNNSGGTFLTIERFFEKLEKEGILKKEKYGRRTYWTFTDRGQSLRKSLLSLKDSNFS